MESLSAITVQHITWWNHWVLSLYNTLHDGIIECCHCITHYILDSLYNSHCNCHCITVTHYMLESLSSVTVFHYGIIECCQCHCITYYTFESLYNLLHVGITVKPITCWNHCITYHMLESLYNLWHVGITV